MHISLYRKYRPQRFSEVVGQSAAVGLLCSSFTLGKLGHAYLFSGPRGCGKTTVARLLAKAVNCEKPDGGEPCGICGSCRAVVSGEHLDVMEIDGASNRGIDQIRELKSHVALAPFSGGRKVYILDEVHMLTAEAFNALLKTLEEPPAFALFIFATTEPHKVPVTIRSRCQHISFHRISTEDIVGHLGKVAEAEGLEAEESALWEIARSADGALRDALSLTEQAAALGGGALTAVGVADLSGGGGRAELEKWVSLLASDQPQAAGLLKGLLGRGVSPERFLDSLFVLLRDMWLYSMWGDRSFSGVSLSESEKAFLAFETPSWSVESLRRATEACAALFQRVRWGIGADVFSGLLMFEIISAMQAGKTGEAPPAERRAPSTEFPKAAAEEEKPVHSAGVPADPPVSVPKVIEQAVSSGQNGADEAVIPAVLPELFKGLWEADLPLCAALLDVKISVVDGALVFDYSSADKGARALLESPRARYVISNLLGVEPGEGDDALPGAAGEGRRKPERASAPGDGGFAGQTSDMSIEQLSAYLGADILMKKSVLQDEDNASDIDLQDRTEA